VERHYVWGEGGRGRQRNSEFVKVFRQRSRTLVKVGGNATAAEEGAARASRLLCFCEAEQES
jgi:hypothetical protein